MMKSLKEDPDLLNIMQIEEEVNSLKKRNFLIQDSLKPGPEVEPLILEDELRGTRTSDLDSDDPDIFKRISNFEEISRRFDAHKQTSVKESHTNDYRYKMYLRKLNKFARYGKMDLESYRTYLNNLTQYNKLSKDFNVIPAH